MTEEQDLTEEQDVPVLSDEVLRNLIPEDHELFDEELNHQHSEFRKEMRYVFIKNRIRSKQGDALLHLLHKFGKAGDLPYNTSTLVEDKSGPSLDLRTVSGHKYNYFGLEFQMKFALSRYQIKIMFLNVGGNLSIINWNYNKMQKHPCTLIIT